MKKKELFLEEAVLDDLAKGFDLMEQPLSTRTFWLVGGAVFVVVVIVVVRTFLLGSWNGESYRQRAFENAGQVVFARAERGIILDRFETPLVKNLPTFRLKLRLVELVRNEDLRRETWGVLSPILNLSPVLFLQTVK